MLIGRFLCGEHWGRILGVLETAGGNEFQVDNRREESLSLSVFHFKCV